MRFMTSRLTPYFSQSNAVFSLEAFISRAWTSDNFAFPCSSPLRIGGLLAGFHPTTFRPFAIISRQLSSIVPIVKWSGLQQAGLSQECITTRPSGMAPLLISKTTLCASAFGKEPPRRIMPYPLLFLFASHGQHSVGERFSIFAHNLFSKVSCFPAINTLWASGAIMSNTNYGGSIGQKFT